MIAGGWEEKRCRAGYFCHVRFLWRFALSRFRRLCFDIFRRRFFFRFPMVIVLGTATCGGPAAL